MKVLKDGNFLYTNQYIHLYTYLQHMLQFQGITGNSGTAQGKLCIVHNGNEFSHCEEGDIVLLVGVKPPVLLVKKASALLAIHGGITSHAAITARENNKPAVVGLKEEVLEHLKNGQMVSVNSDQGLIEII